MHDLCIFYFFFVQKTFLTKNYFLTAEINLTTQGPLYTCLVIDGDCVRKLTELFSFEMAPLYMKFQLLCNHIVDISFTLNLLRHIIVDDYR